jgi:hypothetical protein
VWGGGGTEIILQETSCEAGLSWSFVEASTYFGTHVTITNDSDELFLRVLKTNYRNIFFDR